MASYLDNPDIAAARDSANQAQTAYGQAQQAAITLPDMLKTALSTKLGDNNPIVANRNTALQKYFDVAGSAPLDVTAKSAGGNSDVVFNPAQQQALINSKRGAALAPVSGLNALFGLEVGGLPDIINSTANAYNAQVVGMGNKATSARQAYQDLLQEAQMRQAQEAAAAAAAEDARRWGLTYNLDKYKAEKTGSGAGSGINWGTPFGSSPIPQGNSLPQDFQPDDYNQVQSSSTPSREPYMSPEFMKYLS